MRRETETWVADAWMNALAAFDADAPFEALDVIEPLADDICPAAREVIILERPFGREAR